jgi:hypothetical protein
MRVIVRKERPHPATQLRFTDIDGHRFSVFATDANKGQLADLELRHRRRARCEDRIRKAKDTGLPNLPLKGFAQNQVWCQIVALACELLAWTQMLALTGKTSRWEPRRLRLFSVADRLAASGRRLRLCLAGHWPWAADIIAAAARLQALPLAKQPEQPRRPGRRTPGPVEPRPPTRRGSRAARHGQDPKFSARLAPRVATSRVRKIEVSFRDGPDAVAPLRHKGMPTRGCEELLSVYHGPGASVLFFKSLHDS